MLFCASEFYLFCNELMVNKCMDNVLASFCESKFANLHHMNMLVSFSFCNSRSIWFDYQILFNNSTY
jgi:hypothetical protein